MYYKDMELWKESIDLTIYIYNITKQYPEDEKYGIIGQIRRSAISVSSNIAEGCSRKSRKDTARFIDIAIGSLAELDTQMIISEKLNYINNYNEVKTKIDKVFALLRGVMNSLKEEIS